MRYKAYSKRAIDTLMRGIMAGEIQKVTPGGFTPTKQPKWWDVTKWGQWWETGAKELEKSTPGKLLTAPIRLPAAVISATTKTIEKIPGIVGNVGKVIPIIAVGAVVVGGVILWSKFSKGKKIAV